MAEIRILEAFGEPIADGGQEAFVFGTMEKLGIEGIDCLTAYDCRNEKYRSLVESLSGSVYCLNLPFAPGKSRGNIRKPFREFLRNHPYDIVHIHSGSISVLAIMAEEAGKVGVRKVIVHSHASGEVDNLKHKVLRFLSSIPMSQHVTTYCACSKEAAEWKFESRYAAKTYIIKNGIDTERFSYAPQKRAEMRERLGLTDSFVIGHVGRFTKEKNHEFLISVFEDVFRHDSSARLLLVGAGDEMETIKELVQKKGLEESVIFTGSVNNVEDYLQAMDVFVLPSRFEGLGIVAIEAQSCGLPFIASDAVPRNVDLGGAIFLPISSPASVWADNITSMSVSERTDNSAMVKKHGFDIDDTARLVRDLYMK